MSEFEQLFAKAINASRNGKTKLSLISGIVKSIDGDTCTVNEFQDVRLNAIIDDLESQFTIYPKIGSEVIIGRIEGKDSMFVVQFSEIDQVTIKIGNQLFEIKEGAVKINIDTQLFEMKGGKFSIKTGDVNLKSILNDGFDQLKKSVLLTPSGPGSFSPVDILVFEQLKLKTNQLLS